MSYLKIASKERIISDAKEWIKFAKENDNVELNLNEALRTMYYSEISKYIMPFIAMIMSWLMLYSINSLRLKPELSDSVLSSPILLVILFILSFLMTIDRLVFGYRIKLINYYKNNLAENE